MRNVLRARASILNQQQARRKASRRITAAFFVSIMAFSIFSTPTLGIMQYVSAQSSKEDRSTRLKLPKALKEADSTVTTVPQLADKKLAKTKLKDEGIAQSGTGQLPPVASREKSERRELTEQREANKEVIKNEDGSITEKHYFAPKYFKKNNQWQNVDTSLKEDINAADATNPVTRFWGKVRSGFTTPKTFIMRENEWQARFASSNDKVGMVRVRYGNQNVSFSPENANKVAPVIQTTSEGQQVVIYRELWPGVDLEYTVHSTELKENIVLKDKNAKTNFTFKVGGASLRPDANNPGGYTIDGALDNKFALTPLNFILNNQGYVTKDVLNQSFNDGKLNISVDQKFVSSLKSNSFPAVIDPGVYYKSAFGTRAGGNYKSYKSDGYVCGSTVCNPYAGSLRDTDNIWRHWRSSIHSPYTVLKGKEFRGAKLYLKQRTNASFWTGNTSTRTFKAYHAKCITGYNCVNTANYGGSARFATSGSIDVSQVYRNRIAANDWGAHLMIVGEECACESYKNFDPDNSYVQFEYNRRPPIPTPEVPSTNKNVEAVVTTTQPQIGVSQVADSDGDTIKYLYQLQSTSGTVLYQTDWLTQNRLTIPQGLLQDGGSYIWNVAVSDNYYNSALALGGKFKVDLRTGKDKTSTYDEMGPLSVSLNTGNATAGTSSHSIDALGGSVGLNLTYNSPVTSRPGLTAEYYNNKTWSGDPVVRRLESTIDANWSTGSPAQGVIPNDNFSAKYKGFFVAPESGEYFFGATNDDHVTIKISEQSVFSNGGCYTGPCYGTAVTLTKGQVVPIDIAYIEATSAAYLKIYVKGAVPQTIVKSDWLRTAPSPTDETTGLMGHYFQDDGSHDPSKLTEKFMVRKDPSVDFLWEAGAPVPNAPADNFYARWTGYFTAPVAGQYNFGVWSDDGGRVTVDNKLAFNQWAAGGWRGGYGTETYDLVAGQRVPITAEYFETTGNARFRLIAKGPHNPTGAVIEPSLLSPGENVLPAGWSLGVDVDGNLAYERLEVRQNGDLILYNTDGSNDLFAYKDGGYVPPANEELVIIKNSDATYTLTSSDGRIYVFNSDGTLRETSTQTDAKKPATLQYQYENFEGVQRLQKIVDPVNPARFGQLHYEGSAECDESGFDKTPRHMLCAYSTSDGQKTVFKYLGGSLSRVQRPGNAAEDFGYEASGLLKSYRSEIANDVVAAAVRANDATVLTEIEYDALARVVAVKDPAAEASANRSRSTLEYLPNASKRNEDGIFAPNGHLQYIEFDDKLRTTKSCDVKNKCESSVWAEANDLQLSSTNALGLMSSTIYDENDLPTNKYGPAPAAWFGADRKPLAEYLAKVPHSESRYDEGINGPAVAYYDVKKFTGDKLVMFGTTKKYATGNNNNAGSLTSMIGEYETNSPYTPTAGMDGLGVSTTGKLVLPQGGTYTFDATHDDSIKLWVDDSLVIDNWTTLSDAPKQKTGTFTAVAGKSYRFRLDYATVNQPKGWQVKLSGPGIAGTVTDWGQMLRPNYGLVTSTTGYDAQLGDITSKTNYQDPALSLVSSVIADPEGSALETAASHEGSNDPNGFQRRLSKTLPGGNTTTYQHYGALETRDNPCTTEVESYKQAGLSKGRTEPDPDGPGGQSGRTLETVYDDVGRQVATRINNNPWTCTYYDARGRVTSVVTPDHNGRKGSTITNNYFFYNNPLAVISADSSGYVITLSDLLGRTVLYRDALGADTRSTYDNKGRLATRTGQLGTESFAYNDYDELLSYTVDDQKLASYTYDEFGRLKDVDVEKIPGVSVSTGNYDELMRQNSIKYTLPTQTDGRSNEISETYERSVGSDVINHYINGVRLSGTQQTYSYNKTGRLTGMNIAGNSYQYDFDGQDAQCADKTGNNSLSGKNSNRMSQTVNGAKTWYCYDNADRLIASSDANFKQPTYDDLGNMISAGATTNSMRFSYDQLGRSTKVEQGAKSVSYERDINARIVKHTTNNGAGAVLTQHYGYNGPQDAPAVLMNANKVVIEKYVPLAGGMMLTVRPWHSAANAVQLTLPNMHGSAMAILDANGQLKGGLELYSAFGESIKPQAVFTAALNTGTVTNGTVGQTESGVAGSTVSYGSYNATAGSTIGGNATPQQIQTELSKLMDNNQAVIDTRLGSAEYGWVGTHQKQTETSLGFAFVQMGSRVYIPSLGRFISADPVDGGVDNAYVYPPDPINDLDADGRIAFLAVAAVALLAVDIASTAYSGYEFGRDPSAKNGAYLASEFVPFVPGAGALRLGSKVPKATRTTSKALSKGANGLAASVPNKAKSIVRSSTKSFGGTAIGRKSNINVTSTAQKLAKSKHAGLNSAKFGRGGQFYNQGSWNSGALRIGWGPFSKTHAVFRIAIGPPGWFHIDLFKVRW